MKTSFLPNNTLWRLGRVIPKKFLGSAMLLGSCAEGLADTTLRGNIGRRVIDDDVVIASNTACTLNGTIIKGNIRVMSGAKLTTKGASVDGNVHAYGAFLVDLKGATDVEGDVQGERTRTIKVTEGTHVGGNVQLKSAAASNGTDALYLVSSRVEGDVQAEKGKGDLRVFRNTIGGNLQFVENKRGPYLMRNNRIDGDLQFFKNKGSGTITGNRVKGNLQSKENSPDPKVSDNKVEGDLELE